MRKIPKVAAGLVLAGMTLVTSPSSVLAAPTCADTLGIATHGQHIVGDYVTGIGNTGLGWPPAGQVGAAIAGKGVALAGGPGPGFHFPNGFAPGASFCNPQSRAPGIHPG